MRRAWPWVVIAAAVLLIAIVGRGASDTGEPLDPRSTGPLGARGLVLLLEEMGATVAIGPVAHGDVAVLLVDDLGDGQERDLREWVEGGGTLVVADPLSSFAPALGRSGSGLFDEPPEDDLHPRCSLPALAGIEKISVPNPAGYRVAEGAVGCFPVGEHAYLVARALGTGTVVALGGGAPLINERLDDVDNAVLAVAVMAPAPGTRVTFLEPGLAGSGDDSLLDLLPRSVSASLWQLVVAFVALVLWRSRRVGRPVGEADTVELPGSELVVATGNLLQQAGRRQAAAGMLRLQLRRDLASRFDLAGANDAVARRTLADRGVDPELLEIVFSDDPVEDDRQLMNIGRAVAALRREVTNV